MRINVIAKGFENNRSLFDELIGHHDQRVGELLKKVGEDIIYEAKNNIQQNQSINSGSLLASLGILSEDLPNSIEVGSDLFYAIYVEYGRGPITVKEGGVLHFITKDGKEVFTKSVGPAEPQPFLEPAVIKGTKHFSDLYAEETEAIINRRANTLLDSELLD